MKKLFVEIKDFSEHVARFLDEEAYVNLQMRLQTNPDSGDVVKGCGGIRKLRLADPKRQKGKRGGARLIYLHVPEAGWIFLIDIYGKDEKDALSAEDKKFLKRLAEQLKQQAVRATAKD